MSKNGHKGYLLEELLRSYFLRAGFFVLRGTPFILEGEILTDIDLWLYERPTGTSRRRQMVDIKAKSRPKAIERIFWTSGACQSLRLDGAYVATTDSRLVLRKIAHKLDIKILDGNDLKRIGESKKVMFPDRGTEEDLNQLIRDIDISRRNKEFSETLQDIKSSMIDGLGANSAVRGLDAFKYFATQATQSHPNSDAAKAAVRLSYLCASLIAISLDFVAAETPFYTNKERKELFINAIRYGNSDEDKGLEHLRSAKELVREYTDGGTATANSLEKSIKEKLMEIPAEIIADEVIKYNKGDGLFNIAKNLEFSCYQLTCPNFDELEINEKSFIACLLDFNDIDRSSFARSYDKNINVQDDAKAGPLFKA